MTQSEDIKSNSDKIHSLELGQKDLSAGIEGLSKDFKHQNKINDGEFLNIQTEAVARERRLTSVIMKASKKEEKQKDRWDGVKDKVIAGALIILIGLLVKNTYHTEKQEQRTIKYQRSIKQYMIDGVPHPEESHLYHQLKEYDKAHNTETIIIRNEDIKAYEAK